MQSALYDDGTVASAWKENAPAAADYCGPGSPSGAGQNVPDQRHQNSIRLACERAGRGRGHVSHLSLRVSRLCP